MEWATEFGLDDLSHCVEVLGWHLVSALLHLVDQLGGKEPFAAAENLAKLDIGWPEVFCGLTNSPAQAGTGDRSPGATFA
jgi:hypothetical protein